MKGTPTVVLDEAEPLLSCAFPVELAGGELLFDWAVAQKTKILSLVPQTISLEDLFVIEWLTADACRQVGHQRNAEHLHASFAGGNSFERRTHPNEIAPNRMHHANLGRRFVVRAGKLHVDTFVQRRVDFAAGRAQASGVQIGEVDEMRAFDR